MMRLQKFMADAGVASRRKCEEYIMAGLVSVNGSVALLGMSVDPDKDIIEFEGKRLSMQAQRVVIMLNKPRGVVSTCSDPGGRRTTADYFADLPYRVYNVGRLDIDTEGLLLFTNDGEFANMMMHPKFETQKTYRALVEGEMMADEVRKLERGVMLDDGMTSPARLFSISYDVDSNSTSLYMTIHEGRNRQVRRMLDVVGHRTLRLRRVAIGKLTLGRMRTGEWRYLTQEEIEMLISGKQ